MKFKILSLEAAAAADKRPKSGSKGKATPAKGGKGSDIILIKILLIYCKKTDIIFF